MPAGVLGFMGRPLQFTSGLPHFGPAWGETGGVAFHGWTDTSQIFGLGKGSHPNPPGMGEGSNANAGPGGQAGVTGVDSGTGDSPGGTPGGGQNP